MRYILVIALILAFDAFAMEQMVINFLPDGTEIKIVNNQVFAMCDGEFKLAADGQYELADGSHIYVEKGKLRNSSKAEHWQEESR